MSDFEFIEASAVSFVKRGRKANIDQKMVDALKTLKKGGAVAIKSLKVDPTSEDFKKEKAKISSQIRKACELAGLSTFSIRWSPEGIPQVVR